MLKWLAGLFAGLLMVGTAVAQTNPPDLKVTYLPDSSFTAATRANAPAIVNRAARKSVRFFTAGADLTIRSDTPSIDFGGSIGVARYVRSFKRAPGDFTWVGAVEGDGRVLVVVRNGRLTGTVSTASGAHEILPLGNRLHALIALEGAKFPREHPNRPLPRPAKPRVLNKDAAARLRAGEAATVDVFIGYSTLAESQYSGTIPDLAQLAIDDANTAYTDSGMDLQLRLVGTLGVAHTGTLDTALDDITDGVNGTGPILTAAANAGADMTSFFSASGTFCGQAWLFSADASNATSAVAWDCAVGNHSFAHELGHNFGARHDPYVDSSTSPYAYGHGYVYLAGTWRTIMAYNNQCTDNATSCTRITRFSTPLKTYNSVATGTSATHDNARIHNDVAATVAAFRSGATFSLTVTRDQPGTVTSSPAGISCGATCSASFSSGQSVTLTAAAASNTTFSGWSGACTGSSSTCTVAMTAARAVTATFVRVQRTLTISRNGAGTGTVRSSPSGISCGSACSKSYADGTSVTLTATPAAGSSFTGWSGACSGSATTCTVAMTAARTVNATFAIARRQLTVTRNGGGTGTVKSSPSGINCGTTCTTTYLNGTTVTLTATASTGSVFEKWSGACTGTAKTCTVSMTAAKTVTATFRVKPLLTVARAGTGVGSVVSSPSGINCGATCSARFIPAASVTLTARPATGSRFLQWSGSCTGTARTCTVSMTTNRSVRATFARP